MLVTVFGILALATLLFSMLMLAEADFEPWLVFLYAGVVCSIVSLVFNCVWGIKKYNLVIISVLIWMTLASVHLTVLFCLGLNWWILFAIGIPAQAILLILSGMRSVKFRKEKKEDGRVLRDD